ncbi:MAG: AsmA-like C-terminal region-containing protein [Candidatus Thioglobus sp.]|nr:AsmA-like C-terminal region-containing protein [Candidatus Thioglobus sp.]MDG1344984.1 AsmA-like C-terminal region-containing protein [Candidatus Thioglobus sp.]
MLKKTLLRSLNILKISTWVTAFMALAVLAVVAFLIMFPQTIKGQIESRLSEISGLDVRIEKISLEFQENELFLAVKELQISSDSLKPIAKVDVLRWNVDLMALYKGIEIPGHIDVNELLIDTSNIDDYVGIMNAESVLSNIGVSGLLALQSLSINRTQLIGQQSLDLAPIELKRNKQKISLSMRDQSIFSTSQVPKLGSMVNINTSIDVAKAREERVAVIPFSLQNEDFNLSAQVKIFNQQDQVYLEFESYIDQIEVSKINQNIPESLSSSEGARWIDEVLKDGFLTDIMLTTRFNMSGEIEAPNTKFSANLSKATINANPNWPSIEDINAKVTFSNDYLKIVGNQARVEGIDLSYLSITTRDFNQPDAKLSLNARFDSNSQKVEQFIRETSVSDKIKAYLNEFELIGKLWGNINLVAPLQKNTDQKPELTFDMFASENSLSLFDGEINVDGFNSQISFKDGLIRTKGKGLIGGELFQMSLNPKDWINEDNSALKVKLTHLSSSIDAFISKRSSVEWSSIMKSEDLYADLTLLIDNDGKYILNLKDLNISSLDNINDWKLSPKIFPSLHLSLKDSKVNNKIVPNFEADLINHDYVMEIKNLVFENIGLSEEDLVFNGSWLNGKTALRAKASSQNLSSFLNKFGVNEPVIGGGFSVDLRLYCDCEPWQVAPKNVTGYMQAEVAEGVFTNQDPNLFKLISFINLETIANRFRLTRSELREAGYVYDQINAKLLFNDGVAKVDYFLVESEESDIELTGSVDLIKRDYNLAANVQPAIANTIPLATYLAGGGLAGFGVWAADKMLFGGEVMSGLLDNTVEITFVISGPWSEPIIEKLDGVKVL